MPFGAPSIPVSFQPTAPSCVKVNDAIDGGRQRRKKKRNTKYLWARARVFLVGSSGLRNVAEKLRSLRARRWTVFFPARLYGQAVIRHAWKSRPPFLRGCVKSKKKGKKEKTDVLYYPFRKHGFPEVTEDWRELGRRIRGKLRQGNGLRLLFHAFCRIPGRLLCRVPFFLRESGAAASVFMDSRVVLFGPGMREVVMVSRIVRFRTPCARVVGHPNWKLRLLVYFPAFSYSWLRQISYFEVSRFVSVAETLQFTILLVSSSLSRNKTKREIRIVLITEPIRALAGGLGKEWGQFHAMKRITLAVWIRTAHSRARACLV